MMEAPKPASAPQIGTILVPTDGSELASRATQAALDIATRYGAKVIIVSVVSLPSFLPVGTIAAPSDVSEYYERGVADAKQFVNDGLVLADKARVPASGEVLEAAGSAAESIVEYARNQKVDLIVMGTRGLGGMKKLMLGSVSSGVVSRAHCSVLIVR